METVLTSSLFSSQTSQTTTNICLHVSPRNPFQVLECKCIYYRSDLKIFIAILLLHTRRDNTASAPKRLTKMRKSGKICTKLSFDSHNYTSDNKSTTTPAHKTIQSLRLLVIYSLVFIISTTLLHLLNATLN